MTETTPLPETNAIALRDRLADGALSAVELAQACLERIEAREDDVQAWAWLDPQSVLREAARLDALRASGASLGPLHGLPVGIKDVIDTADMPTENGCALDAGRVPGKDAEVVTRLRQAGALIFGKTVTTELAFLHPSKTRNPHNINDTPGGSSAGSAAAVAAGMIPLTVGTQTVGSVIRPASFCGVTGLKPSFDAISKSGALVQSPSLDTLGVFARDPSGAALLAHVIMERGAHEERAASMWLEHALATPMSGPSFAVIYPPGWERAAPALVRRFTAFCDALGERGKQAELPETFQDAALYKARINSAEMAYHFERYVTAGEERLSDETRAAIAEGKGVSACDYLEAMDYRAKLLPALAPIFADCDAILCPAALGPAPEGLGSTGDSIFNGLWTMAGTPAITLPLLAAENGMPMGVQLVGPFKGEGALIRAAHWLWQRHA